MGSFRCSSSDLTAWIFPIAKEEYAKYFLLSSTLYHKVIYISQPAMPLLLRWMFCVLLLAFSERNCGLTVTQGCGLRPYPGLYYLSPSGTEVKALDLRSMLIKYCSNSRARSYLLDTKSGQKLQIAMSSSYVGNACHPPS